MMTIAALKLHRLAPAVGARDSVEKPWAIPSPARRRGAPRLIGSERRFVTLAAVTFALLTAATTKAGSFENETKLTANDAAAGDQFGNSVGISGHTGIVGAFGDDDGTGSAYLFDVTTGNQIFKLIASDSAQGDGFARSVRDQQ